MTENEAIERLKCMRLFMQINDKASESKFLEDDYIANNTAIESLKEINHYRAIGTAEECREARERQSGKKPIMKSFYEDMEEEYLCCPACGDILTDRIPMDNKDFYFYCLNCGQKLDWSDVP